MAIILNDNVQVNLGKPVDNKYLQPTLNRPYTDPTEVNTTIIKDLRYSGLTVNISGVEWWYKEGVEDVDLIPKTSSGGTSTASGQRIENRYVQASHGFSVGEAVGYSGGTFVKAIAKTDFDGEVIGVVSEVDSSSGFTVVFAGYVTGITGSFFPNPNTTYFLADDVPGTYDDVAPSATGSTIKPMVTTFADPTEILVFQYLGFAVTTGVTGGGSSGVTNATNIGGGEEVFKDIINSGTTMQFRTLVGTGGTEVNTVGDAIYISGGSTPSKNVEVWTISDTITDEDVVAFSGVTGTSYNVTLPASPAIGREITVSDVSGTADSSVISILGGSESILDVTAIINTAFGSITIMWMGVGWKMIGFIN